MDELAKGPLDANSVPTLMTLGGAYGKSRLYHKTKHGRDYQGH